MHNLTSGISEVLGIGHLVFCIVLSYGNCIDSVTALILSMGTQSESRHN